MNCLKCFSFRPIVNCFIRYSGIRYQSIVSESDVILKSDHIDVKLMELMEQIERQFEAIDLNTFSELMSLSDDKKIKYRIELILSEYEYEKHQTLRVPTTLTTDQMKELLDLRQEFERKKMFHFLCRKELQKLDKQLKKSTKICKQYESENRVGIWDENCDLKYGVWHNSMFQIISKASVRRQHRHRLRRAALFGPKLVIDLDFDKYMKTYECRLLLKQLAFLCSYNKYETIEPFDLHFVNCDPEELSIREMSRYLPNWQSANNYISFHYRKSYLDVFPKQRLVYLSPHSTETLTQVSEDDIYIIGGLIDKSYNAPISELKAKEDGIRSAKLPIDGNINWSKGSKHLCINQVLAILHDWKVTKDWEQTLKRHIPPRKWMSADDIDNQNKLLLAKSSKYV